jgi:hypothetical protein
VVCAGNKAYLQYCGFRGELFKFFGRHHFATVTGYNVIWAHVDRQDYGIVLFCRHTVNLTWKALKFNVRVSANYYGGASSVSATDGDGNPTSFLIGGQGLVPVIQTPRVWEADIPEMNTGDNYRQAGAQANSTDGKFVWPGSPSVLHVLDMGNGSSTTVSAGAGVGRSFHWDGDISTLHCIDDVEAFDLFIGASGGNTYDLDRVLTYLAVLSGYDEADVEVDADLDDPVTGVVITQTYKTADLFGDLGRVYNFQHFESAGKIKFVRTKAGDEFETAATLTTNELAQIAEGDANNGELLITTFTPAEEVPIGVTLNYIDPDLDYDFSSQSFNGGNTVDPLAVSTRTTALTVPFVMTAAEAYERVGTIVQAQGQESVTQQWRLPWKHIRLEPADGVTIQVHDYVYAVRIDEITINADRTLSLFGRNYNYQAAPLPSDGYLGGLPQTLPSGNLSSPVALDMPLLLAEDEVAETPRIYGGVSARLQGNFTGALLKRAPSTGSFQDLFSTGRSVPSAITVGTLPTNDFPFSTDESTTITLLAKSMVEDDLVSTDEDGLLEGLNTLVVGAPGRWEIIYFRDVNVVTEKTFELTGLLRGRRGTNIHCNDHAAGDYAYLIRSEATDFLAAITPFSTDLALLGATFTYRAVGDGTNESSTYDQTEALAANNLRPWAPVGHVAAYVGDDIEIEWFRRSRLASPDEVDDIPLGEAAELYDLEILDGSGNVVRTVEDLTTPDYTYLEADQITDGFTPPLATLQLRVYQISASVGRGFTTTETINVS